MALEAGKKWTTGCVNRDSEEVEDETHFVLFCLYFDELRKSFLNETFAQSQEMFWRSDDDRMKWLFTG